MNRSSLKKALTEWCRILGAEAVSDNPALLKAFGSGVDGGTRRIPAVLFPRQTAEVQAIVSVAQRHGVPLYPVSRGRNWGLGSRMPVQDGQVVVDLRHMNRIHEVNAQLLYAVIEPGVTQQQLYEYIRQRHLPVLFNVSGSSRDSSLVGNALERGGGYFAARGDDLYNMEVVLGDGSILQTDGRHFPETRMAGIHRYGTGPALDGLFAQSNLGIVTRAYMQLLPAAECRGAVICRLDRSADLSVMIDRLGALRRKSIIQTAMHIGNRVRTHITVGPLLYRQCVLAGMEAAPGTAAAGASAPRRLAEQWLEKEFGGAWSAAGGLMGTRAQVREAFQRIARAMQGIGRAVYLDNRRLRILEYLGARLACIPFVQRKRMILAAIKPLYALTQGVPTDAALDSVWWPVLDTPPDDPSEPDLSACGLLYCLPLIPMTGHAAVEVVERTEAVCAEHACRPAITLNMVENNALECVISMAFNRQDNGQTRRVRRCNRQLHEQLMEAGYMPCRVGLEYMDMITDTDDPFWQTVRGLKTTLDPDGILAPGRYECT